MKDIKILNSSDLTTHNRAHFFILIKTFLHEFIVLNGMFKTDFNSHKGSDLLIFITSLKKYRHVKQQSKG